MSEFLKNLLDFVGISTGFGKLNLGVFAEARNFLLIRNFL